MNLANADASASVTQTLSRPTVQMAGVSHETHATAHKQTACRASASLADSSFPGITQLELGATEERREFHGTGQPSGSEYQQRRLQQEDHTRRQSHRFSISDRVQKGRSPTAIHYFDRGVSKFHSGDKAGAIRDHSNAIAINPEFAMAYYNRDNAKRHLGDHKGSIQDFTLSPRLKPGYAEAWGNRGLVKTNPGNKPGGARTSREVRI